MSKGNRITLLVGDNPFHGISHLSQERARARGNEMNNVEYTANLVLTSLENGADGFMFSVSDTTISILKKIREKKGAKCFSLYAIMPYAYDYVRLSTILGTMGLGKKIVKQVVSSRNLEAILSGLRATIKMNPVDFMRTYLIYEISRIRSSIGKGQGLDSVLLHEVITDMALALDLDWLFKSYACFIRKFGIKPGFETRNFTYLVKKFKEWDFDFSSISIATPFNKIGFQMNPSRTECEKTLTEIPESEIIAMSILAAGYLKLPEAIEYIKGLPSIRCIVVGVSKEQHALSNFHFLNETFSTN